MNSAFLISECNRASPRLANLRGIEPRSITPLWTVRPFYIWLLAAGNNEGRPSLNHHCYFILIYKILHVLSLLLLEVISHVFWLLILDFQLKFFQLYIMDVIFSSHYGKIT